MKPEIHAGATKVAASFPGQRSTRHSGLTDKTDAGEFGGFMALLSIQGDESSPDVAAPPFTPLSDISKDLGETLSMPEGANESSLISASLLSAAEPVAQIDLTFLLSQSGSRMPAVEFNPGQSQLSVSNSDVSGLVQDSSACHADEVPLPETKDCVVGPIASKADEGDLTSTEPFKPVPHVAMSSLGAGLLNRAPAQSTDFVKAKPGLGERSPGELQIESLHSRPESGFRSRTEDLRVQKISAETDNPRSRTLMTEAIVISSGLNSEARQSDRQVFSSPASLSRPSIESVFGGQFQFLGESLGQLPVARSTEVLQPEMYVAEQVNLWVSQDIQKADLRLKGFDDLPIEVHISMQGKDAQVDFWTDHEAIRDTLRAAEPHLKEMLARDGLVLSGVSVGTSRRDGQGNGNSPQPNFSRQQAVTLDEPSPRLGSSQSVARSVGAIDVFV